MTKLIGYFSLIVLLASCTVNKDLMFKTPKGYEFDPIPSQIDEEYKISPDDLLSFRLFTNNGHILIDFSSGEAGNGGNNRLGVSNIINYLVEKDGRVEFPTIGRVELAGLSVLEAEEKLEKIYVKFYNDPFVFINVVNQRVIVSTGAGGAASVINLQNNNTTVIEAISLAGGIADRGNASRIKVIRKVNDKTEVYKIDLSTIEGIKDGNLIVQAEDIIYIEPTPQIAGELVRDVAPIVSLLSSAFFILSIINAN